MKDETYSEGKCTYMDEEGHEWTHTYHNFVMVVATCPICLKTGILIKLTEVKNHDRL